MLENVLKRLESFGYTSSPADTFALGFLVCKVENTIMSDCNITEIPVELHETAVDMVAGEFLQGKKASPGGLEGFDLEIAEKSIQEGDTRIEFAIDSGQSPEQRLNTLIASLMTPRQSFSSFRRIRW